MIKAGDKIKLIKPMGAFRNVGEICSVNSVNDGVISFTFGGGLHLGYMSEDELMKYFEIVKNTYSITNEQIDGIMGKAEINVTKVFDKCTVVSAKLPNGFVIVESSACVSPENYDEELGVRICMKKIRDRMWELEGYHLTKEIEREHKKDQEEVEFDW